MAGEVTAQVNVHNSVKEQLNRVSEDHQEVSINSKIKVQRKRLTEDLKRQTTYVVKNKLLLKIPHK